MYCVVCSLSRISISPYFFKRLNQDHNLIQFVGLMSNFMVKIGGLLDTLGHL